MDGVNVISGHVEYEHKRPGPADYEGRNQKVSLAFEIETGVDPGLATVYVMALAVAAVEGTLSGTRFKETPTASPAPTASALAATITDDDDPGPGRADTQGGVVPLAAPVVLGTSDARLPGVFPNPALEKSRRKPKASAAAVVEDDDTELLGPDPNAPVEARKLTFKDDVYPAASKVSAHLRKPGADGVPGHTKKLHKLIGLAGSTDGKLSTIPETNWPFFIQKCEELLHA
jgi:hypothetical protein